MEDRKMLATTDENIIIDNCMNLFESLPDNSKLEVFRRLAGMINISYIETDDKKSVQESNSDESFEELLGQLSGSFLGDRDSSVMVDEWRKSNANTRIVEQW